MSSEGRDNDDAGRARSSLIERTRLELERRFDFANIPTGKPMAFPKKGPNVAIPVKSSEMRGLVARLSKELDGRALSGKQIDDVVDQVSSEAYLTPPREAHLRVASANGSIYIDLANPGNQVIKASSVARPKSGNLLVRSGV